MIYYKMPKFPRLTQMSPNMRMYDILGYHIPAIVL